MPSVSPSCIGLPSLHDSSSSCQGLWLCSLRRSHVRMLCVLVLLVLGPVSVACAAPVLDVYFFDVDHGDAILIQQGSTEWLIDTGYADVWPDVDDCSSLFGVPIYAPLEHFILTHDHEDHYLALPSLLCPWSIQTLHSSGGQSVSSRLEAELQLSRQKPCDTAPPTQQPLGADATAMLGGVELQWTVLHPDIGNPVASANANDDSLVLLLTVGDVHFLFTGDLETARPDMANLVIPSGVLILKAPHHDDALALDDLLDLIQPKPRLVIFSTDAPVPAAVERVVVAGIPFLSTSTSGWIHVRTDGGTVWITTAALSGEAVLRPAP